MPADTAAGMPTPFHHRGAPSLLAREVTAHPSRFSGVLPLHVRRAPLLYAAAALAAGILLAQQWRPAALLVVATALLLTLTALAVAKARRLALPTLLLTWVVLGWTLGTLRPPAVPDSTLLPYADGLRREVHATVIDMRPLPAQSEAHDEDPQRWNEQAEDREATAADRRYSVDLKLSSIEQLDPDQAHLLPVSGGARVTTDALTAANLHCGSLVAATVRLYRPRVFRDPGVWSYAGWLAEKEITATGTLLPSHLQVSSPRAIPLTCRFTQMRGWASGRLQQFAAWQGGTRLPAVLQWHPADAAAFQAMLFGDRTDLTHSLRNAFERTGTFHLFVVAGMHVGLVAAAVLWFARRLRLPAWITFVLTAAATTAYALLAGFGPPVQRALWMTLAYLVAQALSRQRNVLNAVGAAVLAILLPAPQQVHESSFQMTVLIALTIGGIAIPLLDRTLAPYLRATGRLSMLRLDARLPPHLAQFRVALRWFESEFALRFGTWTGRAFVLALRAALALAVVTAVSLVTELVMALPMAVYFHRITLTALPANLLVLPLLAPTMLCGIAAFLLCLLSFPLATVASMPAALLLHVTMFVVRGIGSLSAADLRTPGPMLAAVCVACLLLGAAVLLARAPSRTLAWLSLGCAAGVLMVTLLLPRSSTHLEALQVTALDVGQGDSLLLTGPGGKTLLMDAGGTVGAEKDAYRDDFDVGEQVVSPALWQRGVHTLDVLALSHAHMDHLGGMDAVLRNFRPRELWLSVDANSPHLHTLLADAQLQGVLVRHLHAGDRMHWDGTDLRVLGPGEDYQPGNAPANDDSLVLRLQYGQASALLAGDAEQPSEDAMLAAHALTPVTLLKVGHHGSLTSTGEALLQATEPRAAVISCGRGNRFGHPRMPVLERLQQHHVATARTDTMGLVAYTLRRDGSLSVDVPPSVP